MRRIALWTVLTMLPLSLFAEQPRARRAWEWSVEERIAARTNPDLARERVRAKHPAAKPGAIADAYSGKTHPELFLPYQVYEQLVRMAFAHDARSGEIIREGFMPEVRRHGFPEDFWERLRAGAAVYLADDRALRTRIATPHAAGANGREQKDKTLALLNTDVCRSRAQGLAAARKEFGRERFDRFLYEIIAVSMFTTAYSADDPELLRHAERGCR